MKTAWGFVEKYYPNYTSSDEITRNDDLCKLLNNEHENGSDAAKLLEEEYFGDIRHPNIEADYKASLCDIYEAAIKNYLNQNTNEPN